MSYFAVFFPCARLSQRLISRKDAKPQSFAKSKLRQHVQRPVAFPASPMWLIQTRSVVPNIISISKES